MGMGSIMWGWARWVEPIMINGCYGRGLRGGGLEFWVGRLVCWVWLVWDREGLHWPIDCLFA